MGRLLNLPLVVILLGIGATAMFVPALHAAATFEFRIARVFLYMGVLFLVLTGIVALATYGFKPRFQARSHLLSLVACFLGMPVMLAVPFSEAVRDTTFLNAYFEMVSAITTTGATLYDDPARLPASVHLWRGLVAWIGGFFIWVTAIAILAPLNLGGFEVTAIYGRAGGHATKQITRIADGGERVARHAARLFPIYLGLTMGLWLIMILAGEGPFVGLVHAMSTISTSGISPVGGLHGAGAGIAIEFVVFCGLAFAVTRMSFATDMQARNFEGFRRDPEVRMGVFLLCVVPGLLFMRHWVGAIEVDDVENTAAAAGALWGGLFTVLSFLTTTGFESAHWAEARDWSGLATPGLILMGLAMVGGGVATTAGGVKLLRVYALYKNGVRELEKLVHPNSIGGSGQTARHMRRQGAYVAWIFFMLFAMTLALIMVALSLTGLPFETSIVFTISALSTTGPLANIAAETPLSYGELGDAAKMILAVAMVLGRLETLAIIALFNPDFWRN